jgi:molecular chaperone DnaJ
MSFADRHPAGAPRAPAQQTHYAVLGVDETASLVDIRRAYRLLALRFHPDRAGSEGQAAFVRIACAYEVLSNMVARAEYDSALQRASRVHSGRGGPGGGGGAAGGRGATEVDIGPDGRPIVRQQRIPDALFRLSGPLDELVRRGIARIEDEPPDGAGAGKATARTVVFHLTPEEIETGGTAVVRMALAIRCPTCGGVSRPHGVWCRRCEYRGVVVEPMPVLVPIPAQVRAGSVHVVASPHLLEGGPPLRFRFEAAAAR